MTETVEEFLARGGKIQQVEQGATAFKHRAKLTREEARELLKRKSRTRPFKRTPK